jgi:hypothetical protein
MYRHWAERCHFHPDRTTAAVLAEGGGTVPALYRQIAQVGGSSEIHRPGCSAGWHDVVYNDVRQ